MRKIFLFVLFSTFLGASAMLATGCSVFKPYVVDVQQGNVLNQNDVNNIKLGMSKDDVEAILGAPILSSSFDKNYLTYVYTNQINGGKIEQKQLQLYFTDDRLTKIDKGNLAPANEKKH